MKIKYLLAAGALLFGLTFAPIASPQPCCQPEPFQADRILRLGDDALRLSNVAPCTLETLVSDIPPEVVRALNIRAAEVLFEGKTIKACYLENEDGEAVVYDEFGEHVGDFPVGMFQRVVKTP